MRMLLTTHPVAVLNAKRCMMKETFEKSSAAKTWIPFSYNLNQIGQMLVSSVEHDVFPFYGTLFHPEKIAFEW